jgi:hypothetical protein
VRSQLCGAIVSSTAILVIASIGTVGWNDSSPSEFKAAAARPRSTDGGTIRVTPMADSWFEVQKGTGAPVNPTPQGASKRLYAGWWDVGIDQYAILRFEIPPVNPQLRLIRAELELGVVVASVGTFSPPSPVSGTMLLRLQHVETVWEEASLSSLDPPDLSSVVAREEVPWGPCQPSGCGTARLVVTDIVEDWLGRPAEGNHGLTIRANGVYAEPSTGTTYVIGSRESERPPLLWLGYMRVPDEGTATATISVTPSSTPSPTDTDSPSATPDGSSHLYLPYGSSWRR